MFASYNPYSSYPSSYEYPSYAEQQRLARVRQLRVQQAARARAEQEYAERQRAYVAAVRAEEERARLIARRRREYELELLRNMMRGNEGPEREQEEQTAEATLATEPTPEPQQSSPTPSQEDLDSAATKIQSFYRQRRSLRTIRSLAARFESLQKGFQMPTKIEFSTKDGIIAIDTTTPTSSPSDSDSWKLAFTTNNVPIHAYNEEMSRILVALDGVESWGSKPVRTARKEVVASVEKEAGRVEELVAGVWSSRNSVGEALEDGVMVEAPVEEAAAQVESPSTQPETDLAVDSDMKEVPAAIESPENTSSELGDASEMTEVVSLVAREEEEEDAEDWMMVPLPEDS